MDMDNADHSRAATRLVDVNGLFEKTFHQHLARGVSRTVHHFQDNWP